MEEHSFDCSTCETWERCNDAEERCDLILGQCGDRADCIAPMTCNTQHICSIPLVETGCQPGGCELGYCDTRSGACVSCLTDLHCESYQRCSSKQQCILKAGYCDVDGHCNGVTPWCNLDSHICNACIEERNCAMHESCIEGACIPKEGRCNISADCSDDLPYCNINSNSCESPCNMIDCPKDQFCIVRERTPLCVCIEGLHVEDDLCVSNEKIVYCKDDAPENGYSIIITAPIQWREELGEWEEPFSCLWRCNEAYHKIDDRCVYGY